MKRFYLLLFALIIILGYDGLGLRPEEVGRYSMTFGGILYLALMVVTVLSVFLISSDFSIYKSIAGKFLLFILFLIIISVVQCIVSGSVSDLKHLMMMKAVFIPFFILAISTRVSLDEIWSILSKLAVISAVIVIAVIIFDIPGVSIKNVREGDFGTLAPTEPLIAFGYFSYLTGFLREKKKQLILFALICFIAAFLQLHRSLLVSLLITTIICVTINTNFEIRNVLRYSVISIIAIYIISYIFSLIGYSFLDLFQVFSDTKSGVMANDDVTFMLRFIMLWNGLVFTLNNCFPFGIGLNWKEYDLVEYVYGAFAESPTMDSGYYNIIIMFGLAGAIIYVFFFSKILAALHKKRKIAAIETYRKYYSILYVYFLYLLLTALGTDNFVLDYSIMFYVLLALIHIINIKDEKESVYC